MTAVAGGVEGMGAVALARRFTDAAASLQPIDRRSFPELSEDLAYAVQQQVALARCAGGSETIAGYKVSMTSPETRALAGASGPAYGTLTTRMVHSSPAAVSLAASMEPRVEMEMQFIVEEDLPPGSDEADVLRCCSVAPGLEIPESRFRDWFGKLSYEQVVGDNAVSGALVIGEPVPARDLPDLGGLAASLEHEGATIAEGTGRQVMGHPARAVAWLTGALGHRGLRLGRGMVVSSGTMHMPPSLREGLYRAVFEGLGEVQLRVTL